ncbi:glucose dehydrogenase [Verrucomicrobiota bacterium]|nr:glucose dehydrogenase [Verrucomicrobiota bacterium]
MRLLALLVLTVSGLSAQAVRPFKWSGSINVPDPVAVTVDETGAVYATSTTRRKVADLDIREHPQWIAADQALTSPIEKEAFYKRVMAPGVLRGPQGSLKDHNRDGSVDWRDLTVHQERIYKLVDTDGDDVADKLTVFAEGFNPVGGGIAAGILYHDGWVYVTVQPDLWRLKDTDGDGVADLKELVCTGFGAHIAYAGHDMHGLRLGPDGRIYWTIGDKGANVTSKEGRRFYFPHTGSVLRCEPDGTGFEVFASGLRNVQEIAFDDLGNIIGIDNDADQPKERERLVYVVEGSDSGWRCHSQFMKLNSRWMRENIWQPAGAPDQPLCFTPPIANYSDGPAGFLHEPGHALDGTLRGHFILDQFPNGKMDAFTLEPTADGFRMTGLRTINSGIMGIGMSWAPDGRAYFADWIGGYALDGKGAVWRMDVATQTDPVSKEILSLPLSFAVPKDRLLALLAHRDQRVRVNATLRLDRLGAWSELLALARDPKQPSLARIHAVWGWGMGLRHGKLADLHGVAELLTDDSDELRVQLLKVLAEGKMPPGNRLTKEGEIDDLIATRIGVQLASPNPRLRMQAALTLGRLCLGEAALPASRPALPSFFHDAAADLRMPWLRHGLVVGMAGTQTEASLLALAQDPDAAKATFATLALARRKSPALGRLLASPHAAVLNEAARAIHDDDGIPAAQEALAAILVVPPTALPATALRRALNQNLRVGTPEAAARILTWIQSQPESTKLLSEALQALLVFPSPPPLDLVDGTAHDYPARPIAPLAQVLRAGQAKLLALQDPALKAVGIELLVKYGLDIPTPELLRLASTPNVSSAVKLQVLRLLAPKTDAPGEVRSALAAATGETGPSELRVEALQLLGGVAPDIALSTAQRFLDGKGFKPAERQAAVAIVATSTQPDAAARRLALLELLVKGRLDASLRLEVHAFALTSAEPAVQAALRRYLTLARQPEALATPDLPFELLIVGGDPKRGRLIANEHLAANCTACHRFESDEGSEVGPALKAVGAQKSPAELAESLVNPSAKIVPGFGFETLMLKNGETLAGVVTAEPGILSKTYTLRLPDGTKRTIPAGELSSRTPPVSIMPPMLGILTPAEIRDVVAYLATLRSKEKKAKK